MSVDAVTGTQSPAVTPAGESAVAQPQRPVKGLLEKTWDFFSSVSVATVLIFIIAATSVLGSLIEQEGMYNSWKPPADFYPERYGQFWGSLFFSTGMTRMYSSWWYLSLLFMLGASLIVCSLERFIPLWKAVQRPNTAPPESFVRHLKNRFTARVKDAAAPLAGLAASLRSRRYHVVEREGRLYADKGRWGRWGPYITHIGLLLILVGGMMRAVPGFYFKGTLWVRDGDLAKVPGTDWYVQSEKFTVEYYENGQPKAYKTDAIVFDGGQEKLRHTISMNEPLWYKWTELYQSSYKQGLGRATVAITDRATGAVFGEFRLDLAEPKAEYTAGNYKIQVKDYFPDFTIDEKGRPVSRSAEPNNPGLVLDVTDPSGKVNSLWLFVMFPEMEFNKNLPFKFKTLDMEMLSTTGLQVKKDLGIPVIYLGLLVVSLGVCLTFYLAHRRYWAFADGGTLVVGGWTNRNQTALKMEMETLARQLDPETNPQVSQMEGEER